jgi:hypothetical protein
VQPLPPAFGKSRSPFQQVFDVVRDSSLFGLRASAGGLVRVDLAELDPLDFAFAYAPDDLDVA